MLKIITNPNPLLRKKSVNISQKDMSSKKIKELCLNMAKTMKENNGVGLSAPQIGNNIRLIVINSSDGPICMLNPKITRKSWRKEWGEEGCLSMPGVFGQVQRHKKVTCKYYNNGEKIIIKAEGLLARVIQHEIDHLNGVLFIDDARDIKKAEM